MEGNHKIYFLGSEYTCEQLMINWHSSHANMNTRPQIHKWKGCIALYSFEEGSLWYLFVCWEGVKFCCNQPEAAASVSQVLVVSCSCTSRKSFVGILSNLSLVPVKHGKNRIMTFLNTPTCKQAVSSRDSHTEIMSKTTIWLFPVAKSGKLKMTGTCSAWINGLTHILQNSVWRMSFMRCTCSSMGAKYLRSTGGKHRWGTFKSVTQRSE